MQKVKKHFSYANVMSTLAVFLVLAGGTAIAVNAKVGKNSVGSAQIKNKSVKSKDANRGFRAPGTRYLQFSGGDSLARAASNRGPLAGTAADSIDNLGSRVNTESGASEVYLVSDPFTFMLSCKNEGINTRVGQFVTANVDGWRVSTTSQVFSAGEVAGQERGIQGDQFVQDPNFAISAIAPSGEVTTLDTPTIGAEIIDGKEACFIQQSAKTTKQ